MQITVKKNHFRQSPAKIRPVLYLIKRKRADKAIETLTFNNNKASRVLLVLLKSAVAAAKEKEMEEDRLFIKNVRCDQASRLKRYVFKARGRTARITKRNSHLTLTLSDEMVENNLDKNNEKKETNIKSVKKLKQEKRSADKKTDSKSKNSKSKNQDDKSKSKKLKPKKKAPKADNSIVENK